MRRMLFLGILCGILMMVPVAAFADCPTPERALDDAKCCSRCCDPCDCCSPRCDHVWATRDDYSFDYTAPHCGCCPCWCGCTPGAAEGEEVDCEHPCGCDCCCWSCMPDAEEYNYEWPFCGDDCTGRCWRSCSWRSCGCGSHGNPYRQSYRIHRFRCH